MLTLHPLTNAVTTVPTTPNAAPASPRDVTLWTLAPNSNCCAHRQHCLTVYGFHGERAGLWERCYGRAMSTIAVVGGHGKIAMLLHPILVAGGHQPVALARSEEYRSDLDRVGAQLRLLDIENSQVEDYVAAFAGCDAVVFAAGGGPDGNKDRKKTVDLGGSLASIDAAQRAGVRRFVQISAMGVDEPLPEDTGDVWAAYVEAKRDADTALRDSGLQWTIIRPGALTDEAATGAVTVGDTVDRGEITRADVAALVAAALATDSTIGTQWEAINGDTPIGDAVRGISA